MDSEGGPGFPVDKLGLGVIVHLSVSIMGVAEIGMEVETLLLVEAKSTFWEVAVELQPRSVNRLAGVQVFDEITEEVIWLFMLVVKVSVLVETLENLIFLFFNSFSALDFSTL